VQSELFGAPRRPPVDFAEEIEDDEGRSS
jgi:hypothetical protein